MPTRTRIHKLISVYFLLAVLEGIIALFFLVQLPSEVEKGILFGLSAQRLFLVLLNALIFAFFLAFTVYSWKRPQISIGLKQHLTQQKTQIIFAISTILAVIFLSLAFLVPEYRFTSFAGYIERLRPTIIWFALISLQTILFLLLTQKIQLQKIKNRKTFIFFFLLILLLWVFIAKSGIGINPDTYYWNEAAAPILNEQILIPIIFSTVFCLISFTATKKDFPILSFIQRKQDTFIFIFLWAITAIVWLNEPLPKNFFAPGPYLPNHEFAPYGDSATFNLGAQFSLIGQGIFGGTFYARALLSGFLALLHLLVGQNYLSIVSLQTVLFASIAPILYLIGKNLHSRVAGIFISSLVAFKVTNAIAASTWILSVHPKYMLTEFPTAIMLALFSLWFIKGLKEKKSNEYFLLLGGGALGLGIMLRTNILFILPLAPFLFLLKFKTNWKKILKTSILFTLAFFITISPWMWRNQKVAQKPFFFLDIITEVIETRYTAAPTNPNADKLLVTPLNSNLPAANKQDAQRESFSPTTSSKYYSQKTPQRSPETSALTFIPNHFFHNIVTSVIALPTSFLFHDLKHTIKEAHPYWSKIDGRWWHGELTLGAKTTLFCSLFILAIGLSTLWRKRRLAGLIPLFVFLTYHLSNAFARTSGGRYLVPVDWVLYFYYAVGIAEILFWLMNSLGLRRNAESKPRIHYSTHQPFSYRKGFLYLLPFIFFVGTITAVDQLIPQRYENLSSQQIHEKVLQGNFLEQSNISEQELSNFLENPEAKAIMGRSLYPRFYTVGMGESNLAKDAYEAGKDFPRLAFTMIGTFGQTGVVLPQVDSPEYFPNAADVILIGCQHPTEGYIFPYIDALIVIVLGEDQTAIYTSNAEDPLQCPKME